MESLLDFSKPSIDIELLDRTVDALYTGSGDTQKEAQTVLTQFQEHPDAWQRADQILEGSNNPQTRFLALRILDKLIATRWKTLPSEQRLGIRNFVVSMSLTLASDDEVLQTQKSLLSKVNLTLVQILKQDWPQNWPEFIPEIVASSRSSINVCENNMAILTLLSEEVFDFSADQMTSAKAKNLKSQLCQEFSGIFQLCLEVLENAKRKDLILATLNALLRYLNWIPFGYIFETNIIELLVSRFLDPLEFRNITVKCLTEIASLSAPNHDQQFYAMFLTAMEHINSIIPLSTNLRETYRDVPSHDQEFIQNLALFLSAFLSNHLALIENPENKELLINAHMYLIRISQIEEREIFKICLDYWSTLVYNFYEEIQQIPLTDLNPVNQLRVGSASGGAINPEILANFPLRAHIYKDVLSELRLVVIENMARPEEVLIEENDEGEIVRSFFKESDTIALYKTMREVLVYLTHLDVVDTERIMTEKLARQIDGSEWSWNAVNSLSWAIGSISGAMNEEVEKRFLVNVIKNLLHLTEIKRGKDNKAVVASNIMYVVGQYPRFLRAHWNFLKTVVNKLFEFMHETHDGVQDMAIDTFMKISQKCRRHFVSPQGSSATPFLVEIIQKIPEHTSDLDPRQIHSFYEALGYMVSAQPIRNVQERYLADLMALPNSAWDAIIEQAQQDNNLLSDPETVKILSNIMKTNVSVCTSVGPAFYPQIAKIYMDMLSMYHATSELISAAIAEQGKIAAKTPRVRGWRTIKKEVLKLIETYVSKADNKEAIINDMIEPLLGAVLEDYRQNLPDARDAEVLRCMSSLVNRLGPAIEPYIPRIIENIFECTLEMINKDFSDYMEHRIEFFKLLRSVNGSCFPALASLPPPIFALIINSCLWAIKHDNREIESDGLNLTIEILDNVGTRIPVDGKPFVDAFYENFFLPILKDTYFVLTDADHKAGFKFQAILLERMYAIAQDPNVTANLVPASEGIPVATSNAEAVRLYTVNMLMTAFPHVDRQPIEVFSRGLLTYVGNHERFKQNLRDFLVQIREIGGGDTEWLYQEERELEKAEKERAELERAKKVGGLIRPSEMDDDA
ncbi:hypothetical protein CANCADRAFT_72949 [Tortispora caseinolytica NRRL Y-17796]|uniref:Importin N-terminal domain-containing protein n=1 Tax=Tortispora caseinolytica NRRL Y-17796 TaxID=767744 RepID=A0A1E4TIK3_9ASCO|nr:hypothetical protein CANCADRAFT_72949 [Tortispora caseinolytica NRRL Y-17796]